MCRNSLRELPAGAVETLTKKAYEGFPHRLFFSSFQTIRVALFNVGMHYLTIDPLLFPAEVAKVGALLVELYFGFLTEDAVVVIPVSF